VNGRRLPFDIAGGRGLWSSALFEGPDALKETVYVMPSNEYGYHQTMAALDRPVAATV
jgi:hypothetical protein